MFRGTQAITEWASDFVWQVCRPLSQCALGEPDTPLVMVHYLPMLSEAMSHVWLQMVPWSDLDAGHGKVKIAQVRLRVLSHFLDFCSVLYQHGNFWLLLRRALNQCTDALIPRLVRTCTLIERLCMTDARGYVCCTRHFLLHKIPRRWLCCSAQIIQSACRHGPQIITLRESPPRMLHPSA